MEEFLLWTRSGSFELNSQKNDKFFSYFGSLTYTRERIVRVHRHWRVKCRRKIWRIATDVICQRNDSILCALTICRIQHFWMNYMRRSHFCHFRSITIYINCVCCQLNAFALRTRVSFKAIIDRWWWRCTRMATIDNAMNSKWPVAVDDMTWNSSRLLIHFLFVSVFFFIELPIWSRPLSWFDSNDESFSWNVQWMPLFSATDLYAFNHSIG